MVSSVASAASTAGSSSSSSSSSATVPSTAPSMPLASPSSSSSNATRRGNGTAIVGDSTEMRELIASVLKDRTAEGGAVAKTYSPSVGDTCTWYANKQCDQARTCFDCLNTFITGSSCMVDPYGVCVSINKYDRAADFRRALPSNVLQASLNNFPSTNATYCAADDQHCAMCRKTWSNPFDNSQLSYLRFCRGVGGCVCIQNCESSFHNDNVIMQRCVAYGYNQASAKTIYTSVGIMAALCFVFAIATIIVRKWVHRVDRNTGARSAAFRHDQPLASREPTGPQLGLSGWYSMREKLIATEREQLQGGADNQPLAAPVADHTDEPAVVIMDVGDAYVPAPPSDHEEPTVRTTNATTADTRSTMNGHPPPRESL